MKTILLTLGVTLCFLGCDAQEKPTEKIQEVFENANTDENADMPKESWKVTKESDEEGNVVSYDSTYTWSYSNNSGDSVDVSVDSMMRSFDTYFHNQMPVWGHRFATPLWSDSSLYPDFFRNDYFHDRWKRNIYDMDRMFRQMDSVRNKYFDDNFPGMMPQESNKDSGKEK